MKLPHTNAPDNSLRPARQQGLDEKKVAGHDRHLQPPITVGCFTQHQDCSLCKVLTKGIRYLSLIPSHVAKTETLNGTSLDTFRRQISAYRIRRSAGSCSWEDLDRTFIQIHILHGGLHLEHAAFAPPYRPLFDLTSNTRSGTGFPPTRNLSSSFSRTAQLGTLPLRPMSQYQSRTTLGRSSSCIRANKRRRNEQEGVRKDKAEKQ